MNFRNKEGDVSKIWVFLNRGGNGQKLLKSHYLPQGTEVGSEMHFAEAQNSDMPSRFLAEACELRRTVHTWGDRECGETFKSPSSGNKKAVGHVPFSNDFCTSFTLRTGCEAHSYDRGYHLAGFSEQHPQEVGGRGE